MQASRCSPLQQVMIPPAGRSLHHCTPNRGMKWKAPQLPETNPCALKRQRRSCSNSWRLLLKMALMSL